MDLRNRGAESVPLMDTTASPMRPEKDDGLGRSLLARNMPRWTDESRNDRPKELNNAAFSTVQVLNSMIGSGVLSFPYVFANCGWILSILLLGLSAVVCYATSIMLLRVGQAVGHPKGELSEVIEKTLGVPWRKGVDICIALSCLGALLTYYNVIGTLGSDLLKSVRHDDGTELVVDTYAGFMFVVVGLVAAPPCFFREYGELTPISLLSLSFIVFTTLVVMGKGIDKGHAIPAGPDSWYAPVTLLGNFVYATSMQYVVFEMYASMEATSRPAVKSVVAGAVGCGCSILLVMGLGGVAAIGSDVESDVLSSLDSKTILVKVLYGCTIAHLCFYIPNDFIIGRLFFWRSWGVNYLQMPEQRHVVTTFCFVFGPLALMASIPRDMVNGVFELCIALTGEIPTTIAALVAPCLAYRAAVLDRGEADAPVSAAQTTAILYGAYFVLFISPIVTLYQFIDDCVDDGCASYDGRR